MVIGSFFFFGVSESSPVGRCADERPAQAAAPDEDESDAARFRPARPARLAVGADGQPAGRRSRRRPRRRLRRRLGRRRLGRRRRQRRRRHRLRRPDASLRGAEEEEMMFFCFFVFFCFWQFSHFFSFVAVFTATVSGDRPFYSIRILKK